MSAHPHRVPGRLCAGAACLFFFFAGRAFIPHLGVQNDEALFASVLYQPRAAEFMLRKAELPGTVICFLFPVHAGQLRVALDRMLLTQV